MGFWMVFHYLRKQDYLWNHKKVNEGWAVDAGSDWVVEPGEEKVRIINVMDECSRKALWTEACSSISAKTLIELLNKIVAWRENRYASDVIVDQRLYPKSWYYGLLKMK